MFKQIKFLTVVLLCLIPATVIYSQTEQTDTLKGEYGKYRANNDLLFYHLDIRVDPDKKFLSGKNTIRFKMLEDDNRIQLELTSVLKVEKILFGEVPLKYERDGRTVFVDFSEMLRKG